MGRRYLKRPALAALALLAAYGALALAMDDRGFLGTDTGGKVATLEVMAAGAGLDPDVGYWAEEWDPSGDLHPLYYTYVVGGRWVNVSSLPMVLLGHPLFEIGGYRLALLLPMLGGVATALAARALARRLDGESVEWHAFWIVGLAYPVAVYSLDFWEHSIGLALMAWGFVAALDAARGSGSPAWQGALTGLLFGTAATMRLESLVYGAVTVLVTGVILISESRTAGKAIRFGGAALAGVVGMFAANHLLELVVVGGSMRSGRATGTAAEAGLELGLRIREAVVTTVGIQPSLGISAMALSGIVVCLLSVAAWAGSGPGRDRIWFAAFGMAVVIYVWRMVDDVGFVPGMLAAAPLAVPGLVLGWAHRERRMAVAVAVAALPVVWLFQFRGGATAQWGGRYQLLSSLLLVVVGVCSLDRLQRRARLGFVGLAVAVTAFGLLWLGVRSHAVGSAGGYLATRPEPVLIARMEHLPREMGAFYGGQRWLSAPTPELQGRAVEVIEAAGLDSFGYVANPEDGPPPAFEGWRQLGSDARPFLPGTELRITTYVESGGGQPTGREQLFDSGGGG